MWNRFRLGIVHPAIGYSNAVMFGRPNPIGSIRNECPSDDHLFSLRLSMASLGDVNAVRVRSSLIQRLQFHRCTAFCVRPSLKIARDEL